MKKTLVNTREMFPMRFYCTPYIGRYFLPLPAHSFPMYEECRANKQCEEVFGTSALTIVYGSGGIIRIKKEKKIVRWNTARINDNNCTRARVCACV